MPGHGHRFLDGNGIRLEEGRPGQRKQPVVQLARPLPVAVEGGVHHLGRLARQDVGDDGDDAPPTDREERQGDVVVAGEHGELGATGQDHLAHLVERARGFLDAHDVPAVAGEPRHGVGLHVDGRPALDVVGEDGEADRLRHGPEVLVETLLGWLVVVGIDDERPVGSGPFRVAGEVDGLRRGVGAGTGDDGKAVARRLHHDLHHALVLVVAERGRLAGGTARNEAVRAVRGMELHELPELRFVDFAARGTG